MSFVINHPFHAANSTGSQLRLESQHFTLYQVNQTTHYFSLHLDDKVLHKTITRWKMPPGAENAHFHNYESCTVLVSGRNLPGQKPPSISPGTISPIGQ